MPERTGPLTTPRDSSLPRQGREDQADGVDIGDDVGDHRGRAELIRYCPCGRRLHDDESAVRTHRPGAGFPSPGQWPALVLSNLSTLPCVRAPCPYGPPCTYGAGIDATSPAGLARSGPGFD